MAISFPCPNCKTLIQVGEELTGQTGQCPRCQRLILIPSAQTPVPVLLDEQGRPVPTAPPLASRRDKPAPVFGDNDDRPRSRRGRTAAEKLPDGPTWPWALGIFGAIVIVILLFSSFVTLFTYRPREVPSNLIVVEQRRPFAEVPAVTVGRLEGNRAIMQDGVFQIRGMIAISDPIDFGAGVNGLSRHKRYEIELRGDRNYIVEVDGKQFNATVRVEDRFDKNMEFFRGFGRHARLEYWPLRTEIHTIYASNVDGALGEFTLTIREAGRPKPFVP